MSFELEDTTAVLLEGIGNRLMKRKDVALTYALALKSSVPTDWAKVNNAIGIRWSWSGLEWIKRKAWKIAEKGL